MQRKQFLGPCSINWANVDLVEATKFFDDHIVDTHGQVIIAIVIDRGGSVGESYRNTCDFDCYRLSECGYSGALAAQLPGERYRGKHRHCGDGPVGSIGFR